MKSSAMVIPL